MGTPRSAALVVITLAAASCAPDVVEPDVSDPIFDEIGNYWYEVGSASHTTKFAQPDAYDASLPEWQGENPDTNPLQTFSCAPYVRNPHFTYNGRHYKTRGTAYRQMNLPPGPNGLPAARYALPMGPWFDDTNQWVIWTGQIDGYCRTYRVRSGTFTVWAGAMHWFMFRGDIGPAPGGMSGNDTTGSRGGWAYKEGGFSNGSGDHNDWQQVLNSFLSYGSCTPGWEVYVDYVKVCDTQI